VQSNAPLVLRQQEPADAGESCRTSDEKHPPIDAKDRQGKEKELSSPFSLALGLLRNLGFATTQVQTLVKEVGPSASEEASNALLLVKALEAERDALRAWEARLVAWASGHAVPWES